MLNQTIEQIITEINIQRVKSKDSSKSSEASQNVFARQSSCIQRNFDQSTKSISPQSQRSWSRSLMPNKLTAMSSQKIYRKKWTKKEQQLLCNLIGRYGSDFSFLQTQFPNKTRKQLKKKYQQIHKNKHYLSKIEKIEESIIRQRRKSFFDQEVMEMSSSRDQDPRKHEYAHMLRNSERHDIQDESSSC